MPYALHIVAFQRFHHFSTHC